MGKNSWWYGRTRLFNRLVIKCIEHWFESICVDDGTLQSYVGLTSGKIYKIKLHPLKRILGTETRT